MTLDYMKEIVYPQVTKTVMGKDFRARKQGFTANASQREWYTMLDIEYKSVYRSPGMSKDSNLRELIIQMKLV